MGGAGQFNLLYAATILSGARRIVETGVAYGWSGLAILAAMAIRCFGVALRSGGILIPDDIQDNMAFADFVAERQLNFSVTEYVWKYTGIVRK
jgi:predicted O-methyltransferase YrrM